MSNFKSQISIFNHLAPVVSVFRPPVLYILQRVVEFRQHRSRFVAQAINPVVLGVNHLIDRRDHSGCSAAAASLISLNSSNRICLLVTFIPKSFAKVIRLSFVILGRMALLRGV